MLKATQLTCKRKWSVVYTGFDTHNERQSVLSLLNQFLLQTQCLESTLLVCKPRIIQVYYFLVDFLGALTGYYRQRWGVWPGIEYAYKPSWTEQYLLALIHQGTYRRTCVSNTVSYPEHESDRKKTSSGGCQNNMQGLKGKGIKRLIGFIKSRNWRSEK